MTFAVQEIHRSELQVVGIRALGSSIADSVDGDGELRIGSGR
jgi:hypothetical protein